jgi:hypothetical protein
MTDAGRYFDDISEGEELAVLEKQPDLVQVVKWSGATWTFVPIFYDRDLARSHGLPDSLIPGPMKLAYLTLMLRRWAGPNALIRALRTSYRRPDMPRQPITCHGVVTRAVIENGRGVVDLEVWVQNYRGERTVAGAATLELPLRSRQDTPIGP